LDGFSMHAGTWVSARDREKLEKPCRYAARPAVAESRLVELSDGRIGCSRKKRWRDGTTAVVMTKAVLMERLCALVPKPREHLVTYHGVLAPASGPRPKVVPRQVVEEFEAGGCRHGAKGGVDGAESAEGVATDGVDDVAAAALLRQQAERRVRARLRVPLRGGRRRSGRRWYSWAELLQRTLPRQSFSGLLRRPCRQRTRRRAAHVAKTVLQRPPAEALPAEDSATCCARCQDSPPAASCGGLVGRGLGDVQRTYGIEVLVCPKCSRVRWALAAIHDPAAIARVLGAMGLPLAVPEQAGCRAPPAGDGLDDASEGAAE
jgi:hypothetical protein